MLVDCQPICYAAFFAHGPLSYGGKQTGVIYGFVRRIFDLCEKFRTSKVIFYWDGSYNYRNDFYPQYKCKRKERRDQMEAEDLDEYFSMIDQMVNLSKNILPGLGFKNNILFQGYEADDLIAHSLKARLLGNGRKIIISNDNDLYQLLNMADMYLFASEKIFTSRKFEKKYGVKVSQWVKAKSIGGCEGDDIPGIDGVSDPKHVTSKALKFIRGELPVGKIHARIISKEGKAITRRNRQLVKLPYLPEKIPPFKIRNDSFDLKQMIKVFTSLGFVSLCEKDYIDKIKSTFFGGSK